MERVLESNLGDFRNFAQHRVQQVGQINGALDTLSQGLGGVQAFCEQGTQHASWVNQQLGGLTERMAWVSSEMGEISLFLKQVSSSNKIRYDEISEHVNSLLIDVGQIKTQVGLVVIRMEELEPQIPPL